MVTEWVAGLALVLLVLASAASAEAGEEAEAAGAWQVGTPIVTYYAGPGPSELRVQQWAEGGFNLVWCGEEDLDLLHQYGLRGMLKYTELLGPHLAVAGERAALLADPQTREQVEAQIERLRDHPALYAYYLYDEPSTAAFPALAEMVAFLRERDPKRMAYVNLFPTYAHAVHQLGVEAEGVEEAYDEYLRRYLETVQPALLSYDHYQFFVDGGEGDQYFLNLSMVRRAALEAGIPFLNIVQACSWAPEVRVPTAEELRYLVYTTLAYGAQGISYYVYRASGHQGGFSYDDDTPTPLYHAVAPLNREFVAIATELQPLRSLGVYHTALRQPGCRPLPPDARFRVAPNTGAGERGFLLGLFGEGEPATHALVVNLDYRVPTSVTLAGPEALEVYDAADRTWAPSGEQTALELLPGGGKLVRVASAAAPSEGK